FFSLSAVLLQNRPEGSPAAGVDSGNGNSVPFCFLGSGNHHLVRNRIGKQDQKIRTADFLFHRTVFFGKNFGLASKISADIRILTYHSLIPADNDYTHPVSSILLCIR